MNHHLLTIAIGPVQEFIASARRSRDLWFGSWLLSELSKAAANKIADGDEKRLIFPSVSDLADLKPATKSPEANGYFSVVNKITAVVETDNVSEFAEGVFDAMKQRLKNLRIEAFNRIEKSQYFDQDRAKLQIDDLIEYYWASVPLPDEKHYATARQQAEALLIARKNTRDFNSAGEWAQEGVPKSSLDGLRESVIKKGAYEELSDEERRRKFETRPGERLCGVGLLKRLGNGQDEEGFFSTSHVAAFPLLSNLKEANKDAVSEYFTILEKLQIGKSAWSRVSGNGSSEVHQLIASVFQKKENHPCDGRLLFEDRFAEYFEKSEPQKVRDAKSALQKFLKSALGDRKPFPYYALLLADGDGMGEAIKGLNESASRAVSSKLGTFAKGVRAVVETRHHGSLIYAGGDDVLAFVPVHQIVQCAKALAQDFKTTLSNGQRQTPTLSIGVAICHHLDPLSDALTLAREAEKEAKRLPNKNALCVKLDKRSGETTTVVDHWGKLDERLKFFTLLFVADKLPDGVAYEFQKLAEQLRYVPAAIPGEVKRILKRKRAGHGEEELDKKVIARLLDSAKPKDDSLARLAEELIVARALATAREQSHPSQEAAKEAAQAELRQLLKEQ